MENNLLLEQYSRYQKMYLEESPYKCLLNTNIEINPHQINAFCAAIKALKTGGIILADEVGLGKTIEAGLVLKYVIDSGAKRIMIVLPASLRMQWQIELSEKFGLHAAILDRVTVEKDYYEMKVWLEKLSELRIIIATYDYSSKLMKRFPNVKWDFVIIDEAHNLRNVFHGTKRAKNLYEITKGIPKILLTATPLQNSLKDLHGLVSFIDPQIFGSENDFVNRYVKPEDYDGLKNNLLPVLYRTLRKDVGKYMQFKNRVCKTIDFSLSDDEKKLYDLVNSFLKREILYSIPTSNRNLIILVIRKLLASSSFALIDTFNVLNERLDKLAQGTKSADAQDGFDLFWNYVEDEIEEDDSAQVEDDDNDVKYEAIEAEKTLVEEIITTAEKIHSNVKIEALKKAIEAAFASQGSNPKAVIFTESKRTQKYIADELRKSGFDDLDILLFNGDCDDALSKEIYRAWQAKKYGGTNYGRSVEYKHAIVDYFKSNAKILICTDAGSEGLNLQFCNTVINYDLPWNPQKIEQRIGRCHRYGQTRDVVAINLLNTGNEADKRVYEILTKKFELFDGVFGASDVALGILESGTGFEKTILDIFQKCNNDKEFDVAFDKLNQKLECDLNSQVSQLRSILLTESPESKGDSLEKTKESIDNYLSAVSYWNKFGEPELDSKTYYMRIDNWGEKFLASHGTIFMGAFCNNAKLLFPIMLLCDENGDYIDFDEKDVISALEQADDDDIRYLKPTDDDNELFDRIYDKLLDEMSQRYSKEVKPIIDYYSDKMNNWEDIQVDQLYEKRRNLRRVFQDLLVSESTATDSLQKKDIRKKAQKAQEELKKFESTLERKEKQIGDNKEKSISEFKKQFDINPILLVNIVLKF